MSFDFAVVVRVPPPAFTALLEANVDAGRSLLAPVRESLEGSFIERPLRVTARDVPQAIRALGLPAETKVAESRRDGEMIEVLLAGRIDHRATLNDLLRAMSRETEDASFTVQKERARGEARIVGRLGSWWALCGWLEPLLLVAAAAEGFGGEGRAAVFADGDDYGQTLVADVYRVESGAITMRRLDPPNDGFEATRATFADHGLVIRHP